MFLLKNGKWHIPKECIKKYFDHRSIEYIYEEVSKITEIYQPKTESFFFLKKLFNTVQLSHL